MTQHEPGYGTTAMAMKPAAGNAGIAGLLLAAAVLILAAWPAQAQTSNNRSVTLAERQLLLIERMTNSALLAALGIDASPGLNSIHWSRDRFDRMQRSLREGGPHLGLRPTTEPQILETLDQADLQWQRYDETFAEIVASGRVSKAQIDALTASHKSACAW